MADDISQIIDGLRIITAQNSMEAEASGTATKGKKGVIIDSKSGNKKSREKDKAVVSATLTSNETTRYTKIFEILRNVINPDPEAARTGNTAKDKVKDMSATTQAAAGAKEAEEGLLGKLGALGALLATLGPLLWGLIKRKFFEYMGKFLKFLKGAFVKLFKGIGRLLAKFGRFLFNGAKKAAKAIWSGLKKVGKRLLGFLKNAASKAGGAIRSMFTGLWNSKWANALKGAVRSAFEATKGFLSKTLNFVKGGAKSLASTAGAITSSARGGGGGGGGGGSKPWWKRAADATWNAGKSLATGTKDIAVKAATGTKDFVVKAATGTKDFAVKAGKAVINVGGKAGGALKSVAIGGQEFLVRGGKAALAGAFSGIGKAKSWMTKTVTPAIKTGAKSLLTKLPIIGPAIEAGFTTYDVNKAAENPEATQEELKKTIGNRVVKGFTGLAGGALAASLVNFGSLSGLPLFLLTAAVYMLGDTIGRFVGGLFNKAFDMTSLGGLILDEFPSLRDKHKAAAIKNQTGEEMQDFIVQDGAVHPFSDKDSVLGMKPGGVFDSMFKSNDSNGIQDAAVFNDIKSVNIAQLQILTSIRDGIMALGRTSQASTSSGPSQVNYNPNIGTKEYYDA